MDEPMDESCITNEELAGSLKFIERDIAKGEVSKPRAVLSELSHPPSFSRTTLAITATVAGSVTLAWLAFLIWLTLKGASLL
jgi:hypothetical protein